MTNKQKLIRLMQHTGESEKICKSALIECKWNWNLANRLIRITYPLPTFFFPVTDDTATDSKSTKQNKLTNVKVPGST